MADVRLFDLMIVYMYGLAVSPPPVGPSMDPSGVNLIDCIKVYTRTKAGFGWPDDPPPPLPTPSKAGTPGPSQGAESEDESSDMAVIVSTKTVSSSDKLVYLLA